MTKLMPDAPAPALSVDLVGGGKWTLAERKPENFSMVIAYRGLHCPVCKAYLGGFNGLADAYAKAGVDVVAVSMNDAETAAKSKSEWGLSNVALGYGLYEATARKWGLYLSRAVREGEPALFNEPGLFLVRPDGRVFLTATANMPWGRPNLEDLLGKIAMAVERKMPARGTVA